MVVFPEMAARGRWHRLLSRPTPVLNAAACVCRCKAHYCRSRRVTDLECSTAFFSLPREGYTSNSAATEELRCRHRHSLATFASTHHVIVLLWTTSASAHLVFPSMDEDCNSDEQRHQHFLVTQTLSNVRSSQQQLPHALPTVTQHRRIYSSTWAATPLCAITRIWMATWMTWMIYIRILFIDYMFPFGSPFGGTVGTHPAYSEVPQGVPYAIGNLTVDAESA